MLLAYVKPTNYCNVGCTHCYLPEVVRANRTLMDHQMIHQLSDLLRDMTAARRAPGVLVLWHGGEPLTVPVDWFWQAGEILDRALPGHAEAVQTSLVPLRREHLPLIKRRFGNEVGSSIDFSQRQIGGSVEKFHALWLKKVDMARAEDILVIPGMVPTRAECGREAWLIDWFMDRDFRLFNVDRYNAYGMAFPDRPSNLEHSRFLIGLFDAMMQRMDSRGWAPISGAITAAITGVLYGQGGDRWSDGCQSDFVVVEPDGGLNSCPDRSTIEPAFSHVADGWAAFSRSAFRRKWIRHQKVSHKQSWCMGCENSSWCHSGCPLTGNGSADGEDECSGYKTFINHVRAFVAAGGRQVCVAYLNQQATLGASDAALTYGAASATHAAEAAA